ncbi:MAG: Spy/CpxP family protein refolding chaperone [Candidatus Oleimicrobiaceae bacterium]
MRGKITFVPVVLLGLAAVLAWQPALAQEKPAPPPGLGVWCKHIPNLTDEQKQKIEGLQKAFLKEIQPLRNQLRSERFALMSLKTANNPDQKAINAKIDALAKLRAEIEKKQVAHRLQIRSLLTDEQRAAMEARLWRLWRGRPGGKAWPGLGKGRAGPMGHAGMWHPEFPKHAPEN